MLLRLFFYLIICISGVACQEIPKSEAIVGKWKISRIEIVQNTSPKDSLQKEEEEMNLKTIYEFKKDGTYIILHDKQFDLGKWEMSTDERVLSLISAHHPQDNEEFLIEKITPYSMVLWVEGKGRKEKISFRSEP